MVKSTKSSTTQCFTTGLVSDVTELQKTPKSLSKPILRTVKTFYNLLHGLPQPEVSLGTALELAILLGYDGQLEQDTETEKEILESIIEQLKRSIYFPKERALVWLYFRTWGMHCKHVLKYANLWSFDDDNMEAAFISMAYPKQENQRIEELKKLILDRFNNDRRQYYDWSLKIRKMVSSNNRSNVNTSFKRSDERNKTVSKRKSNSGKAIRIKKTRISC